MQCTWPCCAVAIALAVAMALQLSEAACESDASGSKGEVAMQTRIATKKKERQRERAQAARKPARGSNTTKRVKKSTGTQGPVEENETRARALTSLPARALDAVKHHEEGNFPKKSDCTALIPLATKMAKVYEPCSKLIPQTELMEGLGLIRETPTRRTMP